MNVTTGNQTEIQIKCELFRKCKLVGIGMNVTTRNQTEIQIKCELGKV